MVLVMILSGAAIEASTNLISPGKLTKVHNELEGLKSCFKCHASTSGIDDAACWKCHEELKKKNKAGKGLHSRLSGSCIECHTEHKGEYFNITSLDQKTFDHALTGYNLKDRHKLECKKCHKKEGKYFGLSSECIRCHTDVHNKTVSSDCLHCHSYQGWKNLAFDHVKNAEFKLTGKHLDAKCELCHPRNEVKEKVGDTEKVYQVLKFKPIKSEQCLDCHFDVHKKQFKGQECDSCHTLEKGWKEYTFRHESDKYRGFKLEGKHKESECEKCHERNEIVYLEFEMDKTVSVGKFKLLEFKNCKNCHYDVHKGKFKKQKCDDCHSLEKGWKENTFKHESEKNRGFKLEGKHKDIDCIKCHEQGEIRYSEFKTDKKLSISIFKDIESDKCISCHYDIHERKFKDRNCDACHSLEKSWKEYTFRHESTKYRGFKLEGKHKDVDCTKCHEQGEIRYSEFKTDKKLSISIFKDIESDKCISCHFDIHKGQFKDRNCDACHSVEKGWKENTFTHESEKYKGYKLEGKHKKVECEKCHKRTEIIYSEFKTEKKVLAGSFKSLKNKECGECHKDDHKGSFKEIEKVENVTCTSCHSVENEWKDHVYSHKEESQYNK